MQQVMGRLRPKFNEVAGARLFLQGAQDIRVGGRATNAQYQYTLQGDDAKEIYEKLEHSVDMVLDGGNCGLIPTSVIDLSTDRAIVVRVGRGDVSPFAAAATV